eukprot:2055526-Amphidinium_carterae.1
MVIMNMGWPGVAGVWLSGRSHEEKTIALRAFSRHTTAIQDFNLCSWILLTELLAVFISRACPKNPAKLMNTEVFQERSKI